MTPEAQGTDLLTAVRTEVARNAFRVRNGIQYLAGHQWSRPDPTDSDVVWTGGPARLRRYRLPDQQVRYAQPVLAFTGLVSRSYWADLTPENSFVQRLMRHGFDVYILDWGAPSEEHSGLTLDSYLGVFLPQAIATVLEESGADDLNVIGYCMGGNMILQSFAGLPELPIRNLVAMTTAIDWSLVNEFTNTLRDGRLDPRTLLDESGNVPASIVERSMSIRRPTSDLVNYANLLQNLGNDQYLSGYQAISRWVREPVAIAGAAFLQLVDQWLVHNGFLNNALRLRGHHVDLGLIRVPVLGVIALRDDLVPEPAARPLPEALPNAALDMLTPDSGHTALVIGRTASKVTLPTIFDWLADKSEVRS